MTKFKNYKLTITTQGPSYPPSELMDANGDFIVIGKINLQNETGLFQEWGSAIVSKDTALPSFGQNLPYKIVKKLDINDLQPEDDTVLYTLPLPLPCNNYPMNFAPEQNPKKIIRKSYPLHEALIPDLRDQDGRKITEPIKLSDWIKAKGELNVSIGIDNKSAKFEFEFDNLIPDSLYTVMALRKFDLDPDKLTRPGPLGVPNVFVTDSQGKAKYHAVMKNPFPEDENENRIINVVVLWMSTQMSYGGAIGHYGLGGDIHAQLKLTEKSFSEFFTTNK